MTEEKLIVKVEEVDRSVKTVVKNDCHYIESGLYQVVRKNGEIIFIAKFMRNIEEALLDNKSWLSKLKAEATEGDMFKISRENLTGYIIKGT